MRFTATIIGFILVIALCAQVGVAADNDPVTVAGILNAAECPLTDAQMTKLKEFQLAGTGGMAGIRDLYGMFTEIQMTAFKTKLGVIPARNNSPEQPRSLFQVIILENEGMPLTEMQVASIKSLPTDRSGFGDTSEIYTEAQRTAIQKYFRNRGGRRGGRSAVAPTRSPDTVIAGLTTISATTKEEIPEWARMERRLLDESTAAALLYAEAITDEEGYLNPEQLAPWDDLYELYYNWPLFYSLGGHDIIRSRAIKYYGTLTEQCSEPHPELLERFSESVDWYQIENPQMSREFPRRDDWFHNGEGLQLFYDFGLADPQIGGMRERAVRFADWYISPPIYDPEHNIIVSYLQGSDGPSHTVKDFALDYLLGGTYPASLQPHFAQYDVNWRDDPAKRAEVKEFYNKVVLQGDIPLNLLVTSLVTNAYLYTGEEKYRSWVTTYVDGWLDRIEQSGGIIPDNTDMQGVPGGNRNGQWWGGFFGWTHRRPLPILMIHASCAVAAQNAFMLSNDTRYHDLIRSQYDYIFNLRDGDHAPSRYTENGWLDPIPIFIRELTHLAHMSMATEDHDRIKAYRAIATDDLNVTYPRPDRQDEYPNEWPRIQYYDGLNPNWPADILHADYEMMQRNSNRAVALHAQEPEDRPRGTSLYQGNPILTKGLTQVMLGAPQTIYYGAMNQGLVRYFNTDRMRPGVPEDVAVLVDVIEPRPDGLVGVGLHIVNLSERETRNMIVQAGVYAQHEFVSASIREGYGNYSANVGGRYIGVTLPPGTTIKLDTQMLRNDNQPTYAFPWNN
jgi:hypothetical protein